MGEEIKYALKELDDVLRELNEAKERLEIAIEVTSDISKRLENIQFSDEDTRLTTLLQ